MPVKEIIHQKKVNGELEYWWTLYKTNGQLIAKNEYAELKRVIVCEPQYMEIREVINETPKHFRFIVK